MKFYVVKTDAGRQLQSTQAEAKAIDPRFERIDIPTDHDGLKSLVQGLWDEIETLRRGIPSVSPGEDLPERDEDAAPTPPSTANLPAREVPYAVQSMTFEEGFAAMPLALQLHYSALATENARKQIKPFKPEPLKCDPTP